MAIEKPGSGGKWYKLWPWLLASLVLALLLNLLSGLSSNELAYSEFKQLVKIDKVKDIALSEHMVSGMVEPDGLPAVIEAPRVARFGCKPGLPCQFSAVRVADPGLVTELGQANIRYTGVQEGTWLSSLLWWVFPLLLLFGLPRLLGSFGMGLGDGLLGIGKSHARVYMAANTGVTFADVAGIDEAKEELMELVEFLRNPDRYRRLGGKIPKGVLIVGAPGTGKTLLAKAVAGEAGVPFFSISGSEFVEMFLGVGAARVRDLFAQAVTKAPCIIFIDELDALGRARGIGGLEGGHNEQEQTLNQLLVEMDGFDTNKGVILLAATNRPEILDAALLRPGRFDRQIALDRPDLVGRQRILEVHLRAIKASPALDVQALAARTAGLAGADLANLVNEAALLAGRKRKEQVDMSDFEEAIERVLTGLEKKTRVMSRIEKETVAYHEAGHALIAETRTYADRVARISIIPRGIAALGYTRQVPTEDRFLLRRAEMLDRLDVFLGGRVAEELVFGDVSTGAQNDLQQATDMARHMAMQYGMSERLGLASYEQAPGLGGYAMLPAERRGYSDHTARIVDDEVKDLLAASRERVRETLAARRRHLDLLAHALLDKEVLERTAIEELLATTSQQALAPVGIAAAGQSSAAA
ncbi:ATP-dependent zinc metalloprotease FtsH [Pseudoduganella eburnea]|uniref:ATP-dependent zinc metalloprotease FtsH n=1 Tax=Massilia eburnea TaxID=1776165 RepID=A0A6L6QDU6_9BURK|nr:ATP-dependent zinc metalloprotease FtsH [Massilia eburnea]MTW10037.1 ATP-dependent zinc metalloprotease FtsH [Massilia eburnea]